MRPRFEDKITTLFVGALIGACLFTTQTSHGTILSHVETVRPGIDTASLTGVSNLAVSPDSKNIYVTSFVPPGQGAVSVLSIDETTGKLFFVEAEREGVDGVSGLVGAADVAVSADGAHVYVAGGFFSGAIAVFRRDAASGALSFVQSIALDGTTPMRPLLERVYDLTLSPDGRHAYASANSGAVGVGDAVVVFERDLASGALTFVEQQRDGIAGVTGIANPSDLQVSGDGKQVLVAGKPQAGLGTLSVFERDVASGKLTFSQVFQSGSVGAFALSDTAGVLISPNSAHAYVSSPGEAALYRFDRTGDEFSFGDRTGAATGMADLAGAVDLMSASGGAHLLVAGSTSQAVTLLRRDPVAGHLRQLEVLENAGLTDPAATDGLKGAARLASAFGGRYVYVSPLVAFGPTDSYVTVLSAATADLGLAIAGHAVALAPGRPIDVTFTISNLSTNVASNAVLYIELQGEGELAQAATIDTALNCNITGPRASCDLGTLSSAATLSLNVAVVASQPSGTSTTGLLLKAQVAADEFDGAADNNVIVATLDVAANESPVAGDDAVTTLPDTALLIDVLVGDSDPNGDPLVVTLPSAQTAQQGVVAVDASNQVLYTPPSGFKGRDSFSYEIDDGRGGQARGNVAVTVNTPPQAQDDNVTGAPNQALDIDVGENDSDSDGHAFTVVAVDITSAAGAVAITGGGTVRYTPAADFRGPALFSYTIEDEFGGQATAQVTVTLNRVPVARDNDVLAPHGEPVVIDVLANDEDPDGDALRVSELDQIAVTDQGQLSIGDDGKITFTPVENFAGAVEFTYTIQDDFGGSASATVRIVVNTLPVAVDDFASTVPGTAVVVLVLFNDIEPDADDSIEIVIEQTNTTSRENGTVELVAVEFAGGTSPHALRYTPAPGFLGADEFNYSIRDSRGAVSSAKVVVDVKDPAASDNSGSSASVVPPGGAAAAGSGNGGGGALFELLGLLVAASLARRRRGPSSSFSR